jgi:hypothetical protein
MTSYIFMGHFYALPSFSSSSERGRLIRPAAATGSIRLLRQLIPWLRMKKGLKRVEIKKGASTHRDCYPTIAGAVERNFIRSVSLKNSKSNCMKMA